MENSDSAYKALKNLSPRLKRHLYGAFALVVLERFITSFWGILSYIALLLSFHWVGASPILQISAFDGLLAFLIAVMLIFAFLFLAKRAVQSYTPPTLRDAALRLDQNLKTAPYSALIDDPIWNDNQSTSALWETHIERSQEKAAKITLPPLYVRLAQKDPYGMRLISLLAFVTTLGFGASQLKPLVETLMRDRSQTEIIAQGSSFEGWIEAPPIAIGQQFTSMKHGKRNLRF